MLRKIVATGIVFAIGYIVGVIFGFRAAVVDYVEGDAEKLESMADDIYPSPEEGAATANMEALVEDAVDEVSEDTDGASAFQ